MRLRNVEIDEIKDILEEIAGDSHRNAENYRYDNMLKRQDKYHQFNLLEDNGIPVAIGGISKFNDKLVRICDRYCTLKSYRRHSLVYHRNYNRFCVDYFVTSQTEWAIDNGYQPFISLSAEVNKMGAIKRFINLIDPKYGYRLLPDLYLTCDRCNIKCHQHIITDRDSIGLEYV